MNPAGFNTSAKNTPHVVATAAQSAANRIRYIERLALSTENSSLWQTSAPEERAEARILRAGWRAFGIAG
jgi:hypothetical protein